MSKSNSNKSGKNYNPKQAHDMKEAQEKLLNHITKGLVEKVICILELEDDLEAQT